jgi:hypothetical protein
LVKRNDKCYTPIALVRRKRFITVTSKIRNITVFTRNRILIVIVTYKNKDIAVFMGNGTLIVANTVRTEILLFSLGTAL